MGLYVLLTVEEGVCKCMHEGGFSHFVNQ